MGQKGIEEGGEEAVKQLLVGGRRETNGVASWLAAWLALNC
jgi:hypothetical protein